MKPAPDVFRTEVQCCTEGRKQVGEIAMRNHHALGCTTGTRSEHQVTELVRNDLYGWIGNMLRGNPCALLVKVEQLMGAGRTARAQVATTDEYERLYDTQHLLQAFVRPGRIKRQIRAAGLEHSEHRNQQVRTRFEANPNRYITSDTEILQAMRETVGRCIEFCITQSLFATDDGRCIGPPLHMPCKALQETERQAFIRGTRSQQ